MNDGGTNSLPCTLCACQRCTGTLLVSLEGGSLTLSAFGAGISLFSLLWGILRLVASVWLDKGACRFALLYEVLFELCKTFSTLTGLKAYISG